VTRPVGDPDRGLQPSSCTAPCVPHAPGQGRGFDRAGRGDPRSGGQSPLWGGPLRGGQSPGDEVDRDLSGFTTALRDDPPCRSRDGTEGYEEAIRKILQALPPKLRLADLSPEEVLSGYAPEQRLAGMPPEQRLAGLTTEQAVLAMPVEILRMLPADYLSTLPEATRAEIARRLGRS